MHCLYFNIASHDKSIAIIKDDQIVALHRTDDRITDTDLIPLVEQLLQEAGLTYKDLTHLACIKGPGGFTSLRIAAAYANTLVDQLQIPVAGIHLSDLLQAQSAEPDFIWLHATKRQAVFVRGFGENANIWPEPILVSLDELAKQLLEGVKWRGELLDDQLERLKSKGLQEASLQKIEDVLPGFLQKQSYEQKLLTPWYGREG